MCLRTPSRVQPSLPGHKGDFVARGRGVRGGTGVFYFALLCFRDVDPFKKEQASLAFALR